MSESFNFYVPGRPVAQPRVKVGRGHAYVDAKHPVHAYRGHVAILARANMPKGWKSDHAYQVHISFWFHVAKTKPLPWIVRLDLDNLGKAVLDALNGVAWNDDSQVKRLNIDKREQPRNAEEGVFIEIFSLGE